MNAIVHRGIVYFERFTDARRVRDALRATYPNARVVGYQRGYAVQRERSGSYLEPGTFTPGAYSFPR